MGKLDGKLLKVNLFWHKPTQPPTVVGLGLGFGLCLAISKLESMSDGSETYFILSLDPIKSLWEPTTVSEPINPDTI